MELVKAVINLITALMIFAAGVECLETATMIIKSKAIKTQKRGIMSLNDWNKQLNKK